VPGVPLHEGHEIDKDCERAKHDRESDVSFPAFALPVPVAIAHNQNAGTGGSWISFSTINEANSAVI
jgi:hypothetical protein